jgi:4-hydroxy-3-methylbut-2-en-1-yl diphosphate reductase
MQIILAKPRGFCAGVDRAIDIVNRAIEKLGAPIYVRHEVVHNRFVVDNLRKKGAIFVDHLTDVPSGSTVIFSAHGVSPEVRAEAQTRQLQIFDATCPLVTKVHMEVVRYSRKAYECILIGHAGHPEVEGTLGQYNNPNGAIYLVEDEQDVAALQVKNQEKLAFVTQTTLSMDDTKKIIDALLKKFPNIKSPARDDICYATQNRQDAIKKLAPDCDVFLVVGSENSSNSNRLRELAERMGCHAYLIDSAAMIKEYWFEQCRVVGVSAGASAPEVLVQEVVQHLEKMGGIVSESQGIEEKIVFALPRRLRDES